MVHPPNSIASYGKFKKLFVARFANSKKRMKDPQVLFDVHQREGEALQAYIRRFLKASLEVEDLDEATSRHAFVRGMLRGALRRKFKVHKDFSIKKIIEQAMAYADAESETRRRRG